MDIHSSLPYHLTPMDATTVLEVDLPNGARYTLNIWYSYETIASVTIELDDWQGLKIDVRTTDRKSIMQIVPPRRLAGLPK